MKELMPKVGSRIRAIREKRKLSLRALAEKCSLSVNAISLIERGENSPTVSSLHTLAMALEVRITDFFENTHEDSAIVFVPKEQRLSARSNGHLMENLGLGLRNQQIEPFIVTISPSTEKTCDMITHVGQEFVHCLRGNLHYQVGRQIYCMNAGDSLLFEAVNPHCFWNEGMTQAKILLIFQSSDGNHIARQRHLELGNTEYSE